MLCEFYVNKNPIDISVLILFSLGVAFFIFSDVLCCDSLSSIFLCDIVFF
jgi:hypothetical protein